MSNNAPQVRRREDRTALEIGWRLEGHEELCTERYKNLEEKIDNVESSVQSVKGDVKDEIKGIKGLLAKVTWALLCGMAGIIWAIISKSHGM